jgi:hypothetical protein
MIPVSNIHLLTDEEEPHLETRIYLGINFDELIELDNSNAPVKY